MGAAARREPRGGLRHWRQVCRCTRRSSSWRLPWRLGAGCFGSRLRAACCRAPPAAPAAKSPAQAHRGGAGFADPAGRRGTRPGRRVGLGPQGHASRRRGRKVEPHQAQRDRFTAVAGGADGKTGRTCERRCAQARQQLQQAMRADIPTRRPSRSAAGPWLPAGRPGRAPGARIRSQFMKVLTPEQAGGR